VVLGLLGRFLEAESMLRLLTTTVFAIGIAGTVVGGVAAVLAYFLAADVPSIAYGGPVAAALLALVAWVVARSQGWRLSSTGSEGGSSGGWSSSSDSWSSSGSDSSFSGGGGDSGGGGSSGDW
jgi:uncharacterized protein